MTIKFYRTPLFAAGCLLLAFLHPATTFGQWRSLGPFGGDVRSLAQDPRQPQRLFLGTVDSQVFVSTNGGNRWDRLSAVALRSDFVVDHLVIDPRDSSRIYASVWSIVSNGEGGVFFSADGGSHWEELPAMHGQSVRSLAMAPSDPDILVAGTLEGVFETTDAGRSWKQISPPHHAEIRNVESIAIEPRDPQVIYAGTWHLPWKTIDGGKNWFQIHRGIIDDSDVFAIFLYPSAPERALLSACTGIYSTENGGTLWSKFKGIPPSSRRTRAIVADPGNPKVIYAGTTEGLWKTEDGGLEWQLMTARRLTVNAILIDLQDPSRILLGTDDAGVMVSANAGKTFARLNDGFTSRAISSVVFDRRSAGQIFISVLYDHEEGGVFQTDDGGASWKQKIDGLTSTDVHTLFQFSEDNSLWAGTADGAFRLDTETSRWRRVDLNIEAGVSGLSRSLPQSKSGSLAGTKAPRTVAPKGLGAVMAFSGEPTFGHYFYLASQHGLFVSRDSGAHWKHIQTPDDPAGGTAVLALSDGRIFYGTSSGLSVSADKGLHWSKIVLETGTAAVHQIAAFPGNDKRLLLASAHGLYRSTDGGNQWVLAQAGLPKSDFLDISFDTRNGTEVFVTESFFGGAYRSRDEGQTWEWINPFPSAGLKYRSVFSDPFDGARLYALFFREGLYSFNVSALSTPRNSRVGTDRDASMIHE